MNSEHLTELHLEKIKEAEKLDVEKCFNLNDPDYLYCLEDFSPPSSNKFYDSVWSSGGSSDGPDVEWSTKVCKFTEESDIASDKKLKKVLLKGTPCKCMWGYVTALYIPKYVDIIRILGNDVKINDELSLGCLLEKSKQLPDEDQDHYTDLLSDYNRVVVLKPFMPLLANVKFMSDDSKEYDVFYYETIIEQIQLAMDSVYSIILENKTIKLLLEDLYKKYENIYGYQIHEINKNYFINFGNKLVDRCENIHEIYDKYDYHKESEINYHNVRILCKIFLGLNDFGKSYYIRPY